MDLVYIIYEYTEDFPINERFGLTSQMRRSAVSIPSNIAEGRGRGTRKDYKHFLDQAFGSACELQTQIEISKKLNYGLKKNIIKIESLTIEILKMLNSIISKLEAKT